MPRDLQVSFERKRPLEISLREKALGGSIREAPWLSPRNFLDRGRRLLMLIHGFNVSLCEAGCAYDKFSEELNLFWRARSVSLFWPGDARLPNAPPRTTRGMATKGWAALSYPLQIARACDSAARLAACLNDVVLRRRSPRQAPLELIVVAHSLGCRLTLEFLRLIAPLKAHRLISVPLVVLMAAAVPRYAVRRGGPLSAAIATPTRVLLYYSRSDEVLTLAFRAGQLLERPFPYGWNPASRGAIGRTGCGPNVPPNVKEVVGNRRHSGYWPDRAIASRLVEEMDGQRAAEAVARPMELRQRPGVRSIVFRVSEGRQIGRRPASFRGIRRVCSGC